MFYEVGSILLGHQALRSGIDQWFHQPLHQLGFGSIVILPLVTIAALLGSHHLNDDHWKIPWGHVFGMCVEAIGLGLILFWAANAIHQLVVGTPVAPMLGTVSSPQWWPGIVASVGSGIYEELIFRIGILTIAIVWISKLVPARQFATTFSVIAVSLLFAALHYNIVNPSGNVFDVPTFIFRAFASVVFCVLFLYRGFGIAAGAHVAYDVLTQV
jgi:hypothetical protein